MITDSIKKIEKYLKENPDLHYNFCDTPTYKVSMGSLKLNYKTGGGLTSGIHRFCGCSEGGKTSEAFEVMSNFLKLHKKGRGVYVKAEGRLSEKLMARTGLKFVQDINLWEEGTVYVLKTNVYEAAVYIIDIIVKEFKDPTAIIIDSLDGLNLIEDLEKDLYDPKQNDRVAGVSKMTANLFRRYGLPMTELGHIMIVISQVRTKIENKYEKQVQQNIAGSGGHSLIHFSNWVFTFLPRFKKDRIMPEGKEAESASDDVDPLGHYCIIEVNKSDNQTTGSRFKYPIKYGADGHSIRKELEVIEMLQLSEFLKKGGAWYSFSDGAMMIMKEKGIECPQKTQGLKNVFNLFDENKKLSDFWIGFFSGEVDLALNLDDKDTECNSKT